jgi:RHS repeat-associated protein
MTLPGRSYVAGKTYRYGFNGKEKDLEATSTTTYDYGFRIYSPGLGRFLSTDPLSSKFPWITPYSYAIDNPIGLIDAEGSEGAIPPNDNNAQKQTINIMIVSSVIETKNGDNFASYSGAIQAMRVQDDNAKTTVKVIWAANSTDAYNQILALKEKGLTIGNLILESHGDHGGSFEIGGSNYDATQAGTDATLKSIGKLATGDIVLMGCQLGMNQKLMKNLATNTGKNVFANMGESTDWPGMFNSEDEKPKYANALATFMWNIPEGKSAIMAEAGWGVMLAYYLVKEWGTKQALEEFDKKIIKGAADQISASMDVVSPSGALEYIKDPTHKDYDLRIPKNREKYNRGGQWLQANKDGQILFRGLLYFDKFGGINFLKKSMGETKWGKFIKKMVDSVQKK